MSIDEVAALLRVPKGTLYQWRSHRKGPRARKVGRHLRYDRADVQAWFRDQEAA
ncbi:helix-turn-helix transcriptional regulator [Dactylosporangium sp. CS-033363]|uniref:helix-turn-helix transcriptional regulator n=1 Tax=Dactylosporangium sp. CS-033363 TaxID=3239935 RepID=UPI003D8B7600